MTNYAGEPLNVLHTIGLDQLYPLVRVQLDFQMTLDTNRLIKALAGVVKIVPQLMSSYQMADNSWQSTNTTIEEIIFNNVEDVDGAAKALDFMKQPQIRIYRNSLKNGERLVIYLSHILTDGAGAKQLIELLGKAYSQGVEAISDVVNRQDVEWLKNLIAKRPEVPAKSDHPSEPLLLPALAQKGEIKSYVAATTIPLAPLLAKVHQDKVTLNDVFMAAFGRVVQRYGSAKEIALACPTDMRQFIKPEKNSVRIANHTSRYNFTIPAEQTAPFATIVKRVHDIMKKNKSEMQFLDSVSALLENYDNYPLSQLQELVEKSYHVREIAYTNFGIANFDFGDAKLTNVLMTGGFRRFPMYQVAVSTFAGNVSLGFNLDGTSADYHFATAITQSIADLLMVYAEE